MVNESLVSRKTRPVAIWLLIGVFMIMVQVWLGGVTRLTGSGLSITQWDPIMGAVPPLNHDQWLHAFHLYQQTPQYKLENSDFTLSNFQSIFFWEYFHRLWARLIGVVFLIPFIIFLIQKRFTSDMVRPLVILFLLGGLQGLIGWIMVKSGLVGENIKVNHIKLAIHFITAMILLCYTLWFALMLLIPAERRSFVPPLKKLSGWILAILSLQLIYGAFMAGLHAALAASTWPDINGAMIPDVMFSQSPALRNLIDNPITVQFIHRGLAYLLTILIFIWWLRARKIKDGGLLKSVKDLPLLVVILQVTLGVLTVLYSKIHIPIALAVTHQFVAMLLLIAMVIMYYLLSGKKSAKLFIISE